MPGPASAPALRHGRERVAGHAIGSAAGPCRRPRPLPGGVPIITNIAASRAYATGLWRCGGMTGYTSTGVGISGLPVRYFSKSEVALITLRRRANS